MYALVLLVSTGANESVIQLSKLYPHFNDEL